MKFLTLILAVCSIATTESVTKNETVESPSLVYNLLSVVNGYLGKNEQFTWMDILTSNVVQEELISNNYTGVANLVDWLKIYSGLSDELKRLADNFPQDQCTDQLQMFIESLLEMDDWAMKMFDASAKIQSGLLEGNVMQIGNYDECLKIDEAVNGTLVIGQYCTSYITNGIQEKVKLDDEDAITRLKLSYGLCVPAACNATSLESIARLIEETLQSSYHLNFLDEICHSSVKNDPYSIITIISIVIFTMFGLIMVAGTIYDIFMYRKKTGYNSLKLLTAFSVYTNGPKLFSTKASGDSLRSLNGIRVISIMWIMAAHRYMYELSMPLINFLDYIKLVDNLESTFITAGNMAVDTFFVISGLLVVYVFLAHKEKGRDVSIVMFYVHRILRLTPSLAMLVLFYATFLRHIGSGPFWPMVYSLYQNFCERNWWSTLLYVQNYVNPGETCVGHSWYLAVDTQLYFLSPLLLFPMLKWPKRTILAIVLITFVCCGLTFEISWQKQLGPAYFGLSRDVMKYIYSTTHTRAVPWLIGTINGYVLFQCKNKVLRISKINVVVMWLGALGVMTGAMLYHKRLTEESVAHQLESALANSLLRPVWAIALCVIIFLCVTGYGGWVNKFLSCSIFTVLIRLNYNVFLLHILVILYSVGQKRTPEYASYVDNFYYFWGDFVITVLLSILWTLAFESPVLVLEKMIFGRGKRAPSAEREPQVLNNNVNVIIIDKMISNAKAQ